MSAVVTLVGNPKPGSRTLTAASTLADALAETFDGARRTVIDRRSDEIEQMHRDGLLAPWRLSDAAAQAAADVKTADLLVIATPTYKASFTGLLKLFLDVLPAGSLASTVVVPLTVSGGPAHRHLADLQLRPVLSELGAIVPAPTLLLEETELPELADLVTSYVDRHGPVIAAAVGALAASRQSA